MAAFTLSCFGLLLFLWSAFGGSVPLKPRGYEFKASFAEATSAGTHTFAPEFDTASSLCRRRRFGSTG